MRHLKRVSYGITLAGLITVAAALAFDLNPTVILVGLMLIIAGGVKIGMVALWNGVAGFGAPVEPETLPHTSEPTRKGGG